MPTYIIRAGESGPVKIGRADDVERRLSDLRTSNHERLKVLRVIDTYFETEPAFHARFSHLRIHGEWFEFDEEMLTFVPSEPARSKARRARKRIQRASPEEAFRLVQQAYNAYRAFETKGAFCKRISRVLGVTERRAKSLIYGEAVRVDADELRDLRQLVNRLRSEVKVGDPPLIDIAEGR